MSPSTQRMWYYLSEYIFWKSMNTFLQKIICFLTLSLLLWKDVGVFAIDYSIDFSTPSDYTISNPNEASLNNWLWQLRQQLSHTGVIVHGGSALLSWAYDVVVEWNYAYITSYDSDAVEIINISNPTSPSHVSSIVNNGTTIRLDGASGMVKSWNYLYVASHLSDALQILDVTTPASPVAAWQVVDDVSKKLDGARGITKSWNYIYIASDTDDALSIIDVTNPNSPMYTGSLQNTTTLNGARWVKVSWNYAFVTAYDGDRLTIVDISNPASPTMVKTISNNNTTKKLNGAWGLDISQWFAYIASSLSNAVQIIDITDPLNPVVWTNFTTTWWSYQVNGVSWVHYSSWYLYTAGTTSDAISTVDVSVPNTPLFVNSLAHNPGNPLLDGVQNSFRLWNFLYAVSWVSNDLEVMSITYPSSNPQITNNNSVGYTWGIFTVSHTLWANNQWTIKYQISKDGGTTWYYFNGSAWVVWAVNYSQANDITTLNANILAFHTLPWSSNFKMRAYLNSDSNQITEIDAFNFETDVTPPTIDDYSPQDNLLIPIWNFNISIAHSDSEAGIDTSSKTLALYKWTWSVWGSDISSTYVNFTGAIVTSTWANFPVFGLPFGKYKATYNITDKVWNTATQDIIFYVDEVEFNISTWSVDIGTLPWGSSQFSSWELVVTVKTVWAGFLVDMTHSTPFSYDYWVIDDWNGSQGFWYDQNPYSSTVQKINPNTIIGSQTGSINTDGNKNTYTYRIKYGALVNPDQIGWTYATDVSFQIAYDYPSNGYCVMDQTPFSCLAQ